MNVCFRERKNDESIRGIIIAIRISSRDLCDAGNDVEHDMMTTMFFPPPCLLDDFRHGHDKMQLIVVVFRICKS